MGTLIAMMICVVIASEKMIPVQSFVFITQDTALKFSQCLIDKISESQFFSADDWNSMMEVQNVMARAMSGLKRNLIRVFLIAYVTSMAEVVIHEDPNRNTYRKGTYIDSLEQCSLHSTGNIDEDFIRDAVRILNALERNKKSQKFKKDESGEAEIADETYGSDPNPQASGAFYPPPVQPSPVRNQYASHFHNPDDKTVFGTSETSHSSAFSTPFQSDVNPPYSGRDEFSSATGGSVIAQSGGFPQDFSATVISQPAGFLPPSHDSGMTQSQGFLSSYDASSVSQSETFISSSGSQYGGFALNPGASAQSEIVSSSSDSQSGIAYSNFRADGSSQSGDVPLGGLTVPQTKESSVYVIPPKANQQFARREYLPESPPVEIGGIYQPSTAGGERQPEDRVFSMTHSASMPENQYSDISPNPVIPQSGGFPQDFSASVISQPAGFLPPSHDSGMTQSEGFLSGYDASSISQSETFISSSSSQYGGFALNPDANAQSEIFSSSSDSQSGIAYSNFRADGSSQSGDAPLGSTVPQTKESSVYVIPPKANEPFTQREYLPENPPVEIGGIYQPSTAGGERQPEDSVFSMTHSASMPQNQYSDISPNHVPENIVLNILTNSTTFKDSFYSGIPHENAISLARAITEQSLNGYSFDIIKEALSAVSAEIEKVTYSSPENYALALSNALVHLLKLHNFSLPIDGSRVATNILSNLNKLSAQAKSFAEESMSHSTSEMYNPELKQKQPDFDFQNPPLSPEDTDEEIFSEHLARLLSNSHTISSFFCSSVDPQDTVQMSFSIIKSSLIQYGQKISALAASLATGALDKLSKEELCLRYAKSVSEAIAEVLDESAIHITNVEEISNEMALSINKVYSTNIESTSDTIPPINTEQESYETMTALRSSFSENFNDSGIGADTFSAAFHSSTQESTAQFSEGTMFETPRNHPKGTVESVSSGSSQIQLAKEISTDYQPTHEYQDSVTTSSYTELSDTFTAAWTSIETMTHLSYIEPTSNPETWAPDGIVDEEALSDYLLDNFKHALEASEESDPEQPSVSLKEMPISTEPLKQINFENDKPEILSESATPQSQEKARSRNHQNTRRRKNKRKHKTSSTTLIPPIEPEGYQENLKNDNPDRGEMRIENPRLETGSESITDYSADTTVEISPVELMPSFQVPSSKSADFSSITEVQLDSDIDCNDTLELFVKEISQAADSSIDYIHSQNFDLSNLCTKINEFAPLVNIPPLPYCETVASIDYLLNVLRSVIKILKGV